MNEPQKTRFGIAWSYVLKQFSTLKFMGIAIATCTFIVSCTTAPLQPLRVSSTIWLGYEPLFLARDLGYFGDAPIQVIETEDHAISLKRFLNGDLDMITLTLDITLENATLQDDIRTALIMDISNGADALIAQPEIETLSDLKGKRIGMMPGTLGPLLLTRALETANLQREDVTMATIDMSEQVAAFENQQVDALVTFHPVLGQLRDKGLGKSLFDSSQMPGEIVDLLVSREDLALTHAQQLKVLLSGWFKALDYIQTHPEDAIARIAEREEMTPEQVERGLSNLHFPSLSENLAILNKTDSDSIEGMKDLAQFLKDRGILDTVVDPLKLLDPLPLSQL